MAERYYSEDLLDFLRSTIGELRQVGMQTNIIRPAISPRLEDKAEELRSTIQELSAKYAAQRLMEIYEYNLDRSLIDDVHSTLKECRFIMRVPFDPDEELPF
jgi:DNA-binding transcriptional MerR regulator